MGIKRSFQAWREGRTVANELGRLSSRELADIGINAADIPRIARQAARNYR